MYKLILSLFVCTISLEGAAFFQCIESAKHLGQCPGGYVPYDANRVRLNSGAFYNASYLVDGGESYIIAQSPQDNTEEAFWEMIQQERVRVIVSFDGSDLPRKGEIRMVGDSLVRCIDERFEKITSQQGLYKRYYLVASGSERRGVIGLELASNAQPLRSTLNTLVQKVRKLNHIGQPVLIHSTTGVGFTGDYITAAARKERNIELVESQRYELFSKIARR
jgi:hypothetical protein